MGNSIGSTRRKELETAQARHADLEKAHATAQQEIQHGKAQAIVAEGENARIKQSNVDLQLRCEALEAEYQKRLAERDAHIDKKDEELRVMQQSLDALSRDRDGAEEKLQQVQDRVLELEKQESVVKRQLELAQAQAGAASAITTQDMEKLRIELAQESQRNMAELLERMNTMQESGRDELAQAKATALMESTAAGDAVKALSELKLSAARQHEDDGLKLAATLRKLSACELQLDETLAKYKASQFSLTSSEAKLQNISEELVTTKAALANASAGYSFNTSEVDWTDRDYHDRPHDFSHRTTHKHFTVSYKWWDASNDYCVDVREWYYNSNRKQLERTTKGVFLPLPTAQELARILPEVVRQAKVNQVRSPKGSTNS